jgi:hypothetical protein
MRGSVRRIVFMSALGAMLGAAAGPSRAGAESANDLPYYLYDRGTGQPTSMFGTYIGKGEFLVMPFFEYYYDNDYEYNPEELGFTGTEDFRGKFRGSEGLVFLGYGFTDWLAVESEIAVITAKLEKSPNDTSAMPAELEESGLGDVEGQLRLRFNRETETRPEFFGYFEAVAPAQKKKKLIGTSSWEFKPGVGVVKGFRWGTLSARLAAEYVVEGDEIALGEYAVEYLKRISPRLRVFGGVEGTEDEVAAITELQWFFTDRIFLKFNNAFALTSKATDWAPEYGVMFSIPVR